MEHHADRAHNAKPSGSCIGASGALVDEDDRVLAFEDLGVEVTEQLDAPDPREVDQGCGVADRLQSPSDAISSASSSAVVWIVGIW